MKLGASTGGGRTWPGRMPVGWSGAMRWHSAHHSSATTRPRDGLATEVSPAQPVASAAATSANTTSETHLTCALLDDRDRCRTTPFIATRCRGLIDLAQGASLRRGAPNVTRSAYCVAAPAGAARRR